MAGHLQAALRSSGKGATAAERFGILERPDLAYTPAVARETAPFYEKVRHFIPEIEWPVHAPYVHAINRLKKERNAVILAHNYQTPEIYNCVADIVGDSLQLARDATTVDAEIIVQCGVHFMAETSKLLNPQKTVLIPDGRAGCSLSESITGEDVRELKRRYPGVPVVTYVNTSADVKAETWSTSHGPSGRDSNGSRPSTSEESSWQTSPKGSTRVTWAAYCSPMWRSI